jgi:3-mercaptopyruvate sulfurtransferase SseA
MGHDNVSLLDGGLEQWINSDLPLEKGPSRYYEVSFCLFTLTEAKISRHAQ